MSNSHIEAEPFEISTHEQPEETCQCSKCRAVRKGGAGAMVQDPFETQESEAWEEFTFEEESPEEVPLLKKGGAVVAAAARQVAAVARARQAVATRVGLTAEKTCWVQNVLNQAESESLKPDGIFGPLTRAAVMRFQSSQGLQVDGIVRKQTETALIQSGLNAIARASLLPVHGVMDARTLQEIRRFQSGRGLVADGIVGPITRAAMVKALGGRCTIVARPPKPRPGPQPWVQVQGPGCNRAEFESQIRLCNEEAERCLKSALTSAGVAAGGCLAAALVGLSTAGVPGAIAGLAACGIPVSGGLYFALSSCDDTLRRCAQLARQRTRCT
jgi:peptidoglycan hydrolase-like protein with peptidoglycan-binding domain